MYWYFVYIKQKLYLSTRVLLIRPKGPSYPCPLNKLKPIVFVDHGRQMPHIDCQVSRLKIEVTVT